MSLVLANLRSADNIKLGGNFVVYDAGADTLAQVLAAGYFNDAVNHLDVNDVIQVTHAGGVDELMVSAKALNSITVEAKGGITTGQTADVTSVQGGLPITSRIWVVETVGTIGDSTTLPVAKRGAVYYVANLAANSMDVFPASGGAINEGATDAAHAVAGGTAAIFVGISDTDWICIAGA